ncbi:hypothetical protein TrST_g8337 [Triparma strigata]|uniref:Uncharacterized protein n=1 Tax=Triparma strigata TaxID=1606541 RepID=A0A9W7C4M3_9STRA|nr:hypothetical protein TrST_g8337 [Triparma strigata]
MASKYAIMVLILLLSTAQSFQLLTNPTILSLEGLHSSKQPQNVFKLASRPSSTLRALQSTIIAEDAPTEINDPEKNVKWRDVLPSLIVACRPSNIPGAFLMSACGTYRACTLLNLPFVPTLMTWNMGLIFSCLSLVTATSMVVNDYFDARSGTDLVNLNKGATLLNKPMADGTVPLPYAKKFVSILYSTMLLLVCLLPQPGTRLGVVISSILTFLYTNQIKPFTFWKNVSCAVVIACTPLVGGVAVMNGNALTAKAARKLYFELLPLVSSVFFGILSREILMDIMDKDGDETASVMTIPVVYGAKFAAAVSTVFSGCMAGIVFRQCWLGYKVAGVMSAWKAGIGVFGAGVMFLRAFGVFMKAKKTEDERLPELPSLFEWVLNPNDGTITGKVSGSSQYEEGGMLTTSKVQEVGGSGEIEDGCAVVTESGSLYYLESGEFLENGGLMSEEEEDRARECIETAGKAVDEAKLTMILVLLSLS